MRLEPPARRTELVWRFYEQVYRPAFPKDDQAEDPGTWLPLMGDRLPDRFPQIDVVLACDSAEQIRGGVIFEDYRAANAWLTTYLVVKPEAQRRGVATGLMREVAATIVKNGDPGAILLAESENPERISDTAERQHAQQRLQILSRLGFRHIPIDYVQPPLAAHKHALDDLLLLCYAPESSTKQIAAAQLLAFLREFYFVLEQPDAPYLRRMTDLLGRQQTVELQPLA